MSDIGAGQALRFPVDGPTARSEHHRWHTPAVGGQRISRPSPANLSQPPPSATHETGRRSPLGPRCGISGVSGSRTLNVVKGDLLKGLSLSLGSGVTSGWRHLRQHADHRDRCQERTCPAFYAKGIGHGGRQIHPLVPQSHDGGDAARFTLAQGRLPPGLNLSGTTDAITGTPTKKGTYTATVQASGSLGSAKVQATIPISQAGGAKRNSGPRCGMSSRSAQAQASRASRSRYESQLWAQPPGEVPGLSCDRKPDRYVAGVVPGSSRPV